MVKCTAAMFFGIRSIHRMPLGIGPFSIERTYSFDKTIPRLKNLVSV